MSAEKWRPPWFREGVYAEYTFKTKDIVFLNRSALVFSGEAQATYRWECVQLRGVNATLDVSLVVQDPKRPFHASIRVYVNVETRDITLINGTRFGKTFLWLPTTLKVGDTIVASEFPGRLPEVKVSHTGSVKTCQGYQDAFTVLPVPDQKVLVMGDFDVDTGLLVGGFLEYDGILAAMGIEDPGGPIYLNAANIDLGPRVLLPEILEALTIIIPVAVFVLGVVLIFRQIRKRHLRKVHVKNAPNPQFPKELALRFLQR